MLFAQDETDQSPIEPTTRDDQLVWAGDDMSRLEFFSWTEWGGAYAQLRIEKSMTPKASVPAEPELYSTEHPWDPTRTQHLLGAEVQNITPGYAHSPHYQTTWEHVRSVDIGYCSVPLFYRRTRGGLRTWMKTRDWLLQDLIYQKDLPVKMLDGFGEKIHEFMAFPDCSGPSASMVEGEDFIIVDDVPNKFKNAEIWWDPEQAQWWTSPNDFKTDLCFHMEVTADVRSKGLIQCRSARLKFEYCGRITTLQQYAEGLKEGEFERLVSVYEHGERAWFTAEEIQCGIEYGDFKPHQIVWAPISLNASFDAKNPNKDIFHGSCKSGYRKIRDSIKEVVAAPPLLNDFSGSLNGSIYSRLTLGSFLSKDSESRIQKILPDLGNECELPDASVAASKAMKCPLLQPDEEDSENGDVEEEEEGPDCPMQPQPERVSGESDDCDDIYGLDGVCLRGICDYRLPVQRIENTGSALELVIIEEYHSPLSMVRLALENAAKKASYKPVKEQEAGGKILLQQCASPPNTSGFSPGTRFRPSEYEYFRAVHSSRVHAFEKWPHW